MLIELEDEKIERLETGRPFVRLEVKAMSLVVSTCEKKPYGVKRVCEAWRMSSSTVHRHLKEASETSEDPPPRRRPGPVGAMPDANLTEAIEQVEWMSYWGQPVSWRGIAQGTRASAIQGHLCIESAGPAAHARERTARQVLPGTGPWPAFS